MSLSKQKINNININGFHSDLIPPTIDTMYEPNQGGCKIVFIGKPGTGKCLAPGTEILMYDGTFKKVENIVVGDKLMGDDSTIRNVQSTCSGYDKMYKISQEYGESYIVNEPHILTLKNGKNIFDIPLNEYISFDQEFRDKTKGFKINVKFLYKNPPCDPYDLGYYISSGIIPEDVNVNFYKYLTINKPLIWRKIPDIFKINSYEVRFGFLGGVVDFLGKLIGNTSIIITSFYPTFIKDLVFLISSLGLKIISKGKDFIEFSQSKCIPSKKFILSNVINDLTSKITIDPIGTGKYHGFELDGNGRFLLSDFTVTHNTTAIKRLLFEKKHIFPVGFVMSGTEDSNSAFEKIFPPLFIYNKFSNETMTQFIRRQKLALRYLKVPWGLGLGDDVTDDPKLLKNPTMKGLYKNGRHWKLWWILSLQYAIDLDTSIRPGVDVAFIGRESNLNIRKKIYENYASVIPTFNLFCELMDKYTENHGWLVVLNNVQSNKVEDCVFYWNPEPAPEDFKMFSQEVWEFNEERYNTSHVNTII